MTRADRFTGALMVIVAAMWATIAVASAMRDHPGWFGWFVAASQALCGINIVRSVWRDRL